MTDGSRRRPDAPDALDPAAVLVDWLVGRGPLPSPETLRAAALAPYAYAASPSAAPERAALREDFLAAVDLQLRVRAEVAPLAAAWRAAGIEVLLFKGFALAELAYPAAGWRTFGDVDVLLHPGDVGRAESIARPLGWRSDRFTGACHPRGVHAASSLVSPSGLVTIDLHQYALYVAGPDRPRASAPQARVTAALWADSEERSWAGTSVRVPSAVDAVLVGIVLDRSWSPDRWTVRPRDVVDIGFLTRHGGVTRAAIDARARAFRCTRTLAAFRRRCDPEAGRVALAPPDAGERLRLDLAALPERGLLGAPEVVASRARLLPRAASALLAAAPGLWRARHALRRRRDVHALLRSLGHPAARPGVRSPDADDRALAAACAGVHWGIRVFPVRDSGVCLAAALALYSTLRRRGSAARFVSGVRRGPDGAVVGHAWVEVGDHILDPTGLADYGAFAVNVRHPATDSDHPPGGARLARSD